MQTFYLDYVTISPIKTRVWKKYFRDHLITPTFQE